MSAFRTCKEEITCATAFGATEILDKKDHGNLSGGNHPRLIHCAHKMMLKDKTLVESRMIASIQQDGSAANITVECSTLAGLSRIQSNVNITREQFEFLKEIWR